MQSFQPPRRILMTTTESRLDGSSFSVTGGAAGAWQH